MPCTVLPCIRSILNNWFEKVCVLIGFARPVCVEGLRPDLLGNDRTSSFKREACRPWYFVTLLRTETNHVDIKH